MNKEEFGGRLLRTTWEAGGQDGWRKRLLRLTARAPARDLVGLHHRFAALDQLRLERRGRRAVTTRSFIVASDSTVSPGSANCCSRCDRFTVSPTTVYSMRSSEPSSAAATSPVDTPMPSPNAGRPSAAHFSLSARLLRVHRGGGLDRFRRVLFHRDRCAEHRHHGVADELHHRAAGRR